MNFVNSSEQIIDNVLRFDGYRESSRPSERDFFRERLCLGKIFVYLPQGNRHIFCPSRFVGYQDNTMQKHNVFDEKHGGRTTPRITRVLGARASSDQRVEALYRRLCETVSVVPSQKDRQYWVLNPVRAERAITLNHGEEGFPDELADVSGYAEGAVRRVVVNAYERNPLARQRCIEVYGYQCIVCGFDFERVYGGVGREFIHVHHLEPLATREAEYQVDPVHDLVRPRTSMKVLYYVGQIEWTCHQLHSFSPIWQPSV